MSKLREKHLEMVFTDIWVKLEDAEKTRFTRGGSDFFLINLREQKTASAKIENSLIFGKYYKTLADYKAETFSNN